MLLNLAYLAHIRGSLLLHCRQVVCRGRSHRTSVVKASLSLPILPPLFLPSLSSFCSIGVKAIIISFSILNQLLQMLMNVYHRFDSRIVKRLVFVINSFLLVIFSIPFLFSFFLQEYLVFDAKIVFF